VQAIYCGIITISGDKYIPVLVKDSCALSLLASANFPDRLGPQTIHERANLGTSLMRTGGPYTRYAMRNYRNTKWWKEAPGLLVRDTKKSREYKRQGHRILICPRFALLIRQRCMLISANTVFIILSDVDGRRTGICAAEIAGCRLRRGEPRVTLRATPRRTCDSIRNLYIFSD